MGRRVAVGMRREGGTRGRAGPRGLVGTQARSSTLQRDSPGTTWGLRGSLVQCRKPHLWILPDEPPGRDFLCILEETALHPVSPSLGLNVMSDYSEMSPFSLGELLKSLALGSNLIHPAPTQHIPPSHSFTPAFSGWPFFSPPSELFLLL